MKKSFMFLAVAAVIMAVSACGNNNQKAAEAEAEEAVEIAEECCDAADSLCTEVCDSTAVEAIAE